MDKHLLHEYIAAYKRDFDYVNREELYKWKAVEWFQSNWDINAPNFAEMLSISLERTENLIKSGQYYPRRMIRFLSQGRPEEVRSLFVNLYDEDEDLYKRIRDFQLGIDEINRQLFPNRKAYQDHRAIIVYLSLKFPERYFFYKFEMYKDFASKLNLLYKPIAGRIENVGNFNIVCELIKHEISQDQELLKLHKDRITDNCYYDESLHILTQDFIYAVVKHIGSVRIVPLPSNPSATVQSFVKAADISVRNEPVSFAGRVVNFIENTIENKRIGDLGEDWVVKYEREKLNKLKKPKLAQKVRNVARDEGDGTGYDVLSFDEKGKKMFIEVKTTTGAKNTVFYITRNEFEKSQAETTAFFLYRVYNYNEVTDTADLYVINGDLNSLCKVPILYKVSLTN